MAAGKGTIPLIASYLPPCLMPTHQLEILIGMKIFAMAEIVIVSLIIFGLEEIMTVSLIIFCLVWRFGNIWIPALFRVSGDFNEEEKGS